MKFNRVSIATSLMLLTLLGVFVWITWASSAIFGYEINKYTAPAVATSVYYVEGEGWHNLTTAFGQTRANLQYGPEVTLQKIKLKTRLWEKIRLEPPSEQPTYCQKDTVNYTCVGSACVHYSGGIYHKNWTRISQIIYPLATDPANAGYYVMNVHKLIDTRATNPNNNNQPPGNFYTTDGPSTSTQSVLAGYYKDGNGLSGCTYKETSQDADDD